MNYVPDIDVSITFLDKDKKARTVNIAGQDNHIKAQILYIGAHVVKIVDLIVNIIIQIYLICG